MSFLLSSSLTEKSSNRHINLSSHNMNESRWDSERTCFMRHIRLDEVLWPRQVFFVQNLPNTNRSWARSSKFFASFDTVTHLLRSSRCYVLSFGTWGTSTWPCWQFWEGGAGSRGGTLGCRCDTAEDLHLLYTPRSDHHAAAPPVCHTTVKDRCYTRYLQSYRYHQYYTTPWCQLEKLACISKTLWKWHDLFRRWHHFTTRFGMI